jgi:hypothetical protein
LAARRFASNEAPIPPTPPAGEIANKEGEGHAITQQIPKDVMAAEVISGAPGMSLESLNLCNGALTAGMPQMNCDTDKSVFSSRHATPCRAAVLKEHGGESTLTFSRVQGDGRIH